MQRHTRFLYACANFLGMIAVATAGAINQNFSCLATKVVNDSETVLSLIKNLDRFFTDQREQYAADSPAYEEIPDRSSQTSDTFKFGHLARIDTCPDLSADRQQRSEAYAVTCNIS